MEISIVRRNIQSVFITPISGMFNNNYQILLHVVVKKINIFEATRYSW